MGLLGTVYLVGEVVGALVFGRLTDRLGRKSLFIMTLAHLPDRQRHRGASRPTLWFLLLFRFVAGMGIGGEYTAINSAIDELIPSHYRGRVDIAINGTYWAGAALGAAASICPAQPRPAPRQRRLAHRPSSSARCSVWSSSSCAGTSPRARAG